LILLDVRFADPRSPQADRFGLLLLKEIRDRFGRALPIVLLTTRKHVRDDANRLMADGFLPKEDLSRETLDLQLNRNGLLKDPSLIGTAPVFLIMLRELRRLVLGGTKDLMLLGEAGSGKSEIARYVHRMTGLPRSAGPFKVCFARATSAELHVDELFGHWKDSFTGADAHKAGVGELANKGRYSWTRLQSLARRSDGAFGVSNLGEGRQATHLEDRASTVEDRKQTTVRPPREYDPIEQKVLVDTMLISATNRPIDDATWRAQYRFRDDLYFKLGHRVVVPPLRDRRQDILRCFEGSFATSRPNVS